MSRAFRADWLRLRCSAALWATLAASGILTGGFAVLLVLLSGRPSGSGAGVTTSVTRAQLIRPTGLASLMQPADTFVVPLIALVIVGGTIAADYRDGMIRVLLTQQPGRVALLAGKLTALGACLVLAAATALAAALAVGTPLAVARGIAVGAWFHPAGLAATAAAAGNGLLTSAGWGLIAAALAVLTRSGAVTIGVAVGYLLVVENLLASAWQAARHWFPGHVLSAVGSGGVTGLPYGRALLLGALYLLIVVGAGGVVFARRDVTE